MRDWQRVWPAPAKINLFLHVVGRRADGYHLLQTVFRFLSYGDELRFTPRDDGEIALATPIPGVPQESDLTVRAAHLLRGYANASTGVTIHLNKRLPLGGGLGGGSSDAATTLMALNELWEIHLSSVELQRLGLGLGADVPVFIHGRSCFAEGVGEQFSDVVLPAAWYLVTVPSVAVPTAEIFKSGDLRRDTPPVTPGSWRPGDGHNDLEPVACRLHPEIAAHLAWLRARGRASMSGSGACCFAEFATEADAQRVWAELPSGWTGFIACGLDSHPMRI
jgi:4-diphosphocytidyl-2-C-methyl-D-erythritol kinase